MSDLEQIIRRNVRAAIDGQAGERAALATSVILADVAKEQAQRTDWRPPAGSCLSEIVADRIRTLRRMCGMNRAALCERFNELSTQAGRGDDDDRYGGLVMSEAVLTNIESGRTRDGGRRRMVAVDEVVVFAKALGVTPAALMDPNASEAAAIGAAIRKSIGVTP